MVTLIMPRGQAVQTFHNFCNILYKNYHSTIALIFQINTINLGAKWIPEYKRWKWLCIGEFSNKLDSLFPIYSIDGAVNKEMEQLGCSWKSFIFFLSVREINLPVCCSLKIFLRISFFFFMLSKSPPNFFSNILFISRKESFFTFLNLVKKVREFNVYKNWEKKIVSMLKKWNPSHPKKMLLSLGQIRDFSLGRCNYEKFWMRALDQYEDTKNFIWLWQLTKKFILF